jgi:hypothetical protein
MMEGGPLEHFEEERRRRSRFFFMLPGDVLFSDALRSIASHGPSVTAYLMILARQPLPPRAKERKRLEKAGMWPPKPAPFSFPIREARFHGLTEKGLSAALQALHGVGLIDRQHPGSATKGDFATYLLSERWKRWGKPDFVTLLWERAKVICARDDGGKFVPHRIGKRSRGKFVVAEIATTKREPMAENATTTPRVVAENAMNEPFSPPLVVADSAIFLSSPCLSEDSGTGNKVLGIEEEEGTSNSAPSGNVASELLSHLPLDRQLYILGLLRQVEDGELLARHARTKVVMPRLIPAEDAFLLFPEPLRYGAWGPLEDRLTARGWT